MQNYTEIEKVSMFAGVAQQDDDVGESGWQSGKVCLLVEVAST